MSITASDSVARKNEPEPVTANATGRADDGRRDTKDDMPASVQDSSLSLMIGLSDGQAHSGAATGPRFTTIHVPTARSMSVEADSPFQRSSEVSDTLLRVAIEDHESLRTHA